ncbi:8-oxo-dGTP diphosphatase [Stackebrandtia albiflava]|uniref:8-oxo-dGTP diphosphatase n=1 Tax=Stackebrandtia albiflava TaxID=406432 RepID=A0A562V0Q5_9ACTN|nr:NUDIX domain-containing protein [Stackebrandtia albiflava]TWJ11496.1 8-oxo-dGTP diphosphatase [Stackebrandtia albiflava]
MPEPVAKFAVTVDLVILTVQRDVLHVLTVTRAVPPFEGRAALPGGFVHPDEPLPAAATRELSDETGLPHDAGHLEQLATYGEPGRDPRGRVITVAYLALLADPPQPAGSADWTATGPLLADPAALAFDHHRILSDGVERARAKLEYSSLAAQFCPPEFTIAQLRRIYETVWGTRLDPRNFHRKVTGTPGFVVATDHHTSSDRGRPARLYRRGPATSLHPPLLRR